MSEQAQAGSDVVIAYGPRAGGLSAQALEQQIASVWSTKIKTAEGRAQIAKALGVEPEQLGHPAPPFEVKKDTSGFLGVDLVVAAHWAAVSILLPALADIAKDQLKPRLLQLWRQVIKPAIDGDDDDKFGNERTGRD